MTRTLARHAPGSFKTLPLQVEANAEALSYRSLGLPLNFAQMRKRRQPIEVTDSQCFSLALANLGVSVRLTLSWQGHEYWVVVRQQREDRGDVVLKLISGYVPAHELNLPLMTAIHEVAEECLLETPHGWLAGRYAGTWLPTPYQRHLHYRESPVFQLSPLSGSARPVRCGSLNLLERPRAYVHLPTSSLQLVYDMRLEVPAGQSQLSLFHVEERLIGNKLVARLQRQQPDLYLIPLHNGKPQPQLFSVQQGKLEPVVTQELWLSESFAEQEGWVVRAERIRWQDWLLRQGFLLGAAGQLAS